MKHLHQLVVPGMRVVDQELGGIKNFGDVVAGDAGCHAHGNAGAAVGKQVGKQARKDFGLFLLAIIGGVEGDRAVFQPRHQLHRRFGQPGFGIAIGGGVIAVDIAEIALPFDQRIAQREILREAHHRVIDRLIAMRVIFTDDIANHAGGFLERVGRVELQLPHRPQQAAVHRLQPVAQVGQRAGGDGRKRIDQIPLRQRAIEGRVDNGGEGIGFDDVGRIAHDRASLAAQSPPPKPWQA